MITWVLPLLLLAGTPDVRLEMLDGTSIDGQVSQWTDNQLVLADGSRQVPLPTSQLLRLVVNGSGKPTARLSSPLQIVFSDGSVCHAIQMVSDQGTATITLPGNVSIVCDVRVLGAVRLLDAESEAMTESWDAIASNPAESDRLMIRKPEQKLDFLDGVIGAVQPDTIQFTLDGDTVEVARTKLAGWIYLPSKTAKLPNVTARITDHDGNIWEAAGIAFADDRLAVTTRAGIEIRMDLAHVSSVDFGAANLIYVSDLEPLKFEWTPFLPIRGASERLARLFGPRFYDGSEPYKLALRFAHQEPSIREYTRGLALHSRTELSYRVPAGSTRLRGMVGLDPRSPQPGRVRLLVTLDGRPLLDRVLEASEDPFPLDLEVAEGGHLKLVVDFGDDSPIGDQVHLCDLRFVR